jgi:hypothetical protein
MAEEHPEPPAKSTRFFRLSLDMIVAVSAVVVSVCAIAVSLMQTEIMQRQQAADVWPHVTIGMSSDTGPAPAVRFHLQNSGVGPALIRWVELRLDGKPVTSWEALGGALTDASTARFRQVATLNGRVLMAGETAIVHQPYERPLIEAIIAARDRIDLRACYCSIQDECWMAEFLNVGANTSVPRCPATDRDTFTQ